MLESLDLNRSLSRKDYKAHVPKLQARLHQLQRVCWKTGWSPILLLEGWPLADRGKVIRKLTERLEPRGFDVSWLREMRSHHGSMPAMWRFWKRLPSYGSFAIFDGSWYRRVTVERNEKMPRSHATSTAFQEIVEFERTITADNYGLIKLFLHIDREEHEKRIKHLDSDAGWTWQTELDEWSKNQPYESQLEAYEEMLETTESEWGPWSLIEGHDMRWTRLRVLETAIERIEACLTERGIEPPPPFEVSRPTTKASKNEPADATAPKASDP